MEATQEPVTSTLTTTAVETPTPTSAPTTPEPSSTPSINQPQKPISAREALERTATPTPDGTADQPAGAITQPADPTQPGEPKSTVPPEARWPTILENARKEASTQAVQARDQQWQRETGWVVSLPPEQRAGLRNIARDIYSNPVVFGERYVQQLLQDPKHGAAFKATLASLIGAGRPTEDAEPPPDVQIMNEHGQAVSMGYSAAQQVKREAWLKKQYFAEIDQRIAPLREDRDRRIAEQESAEFHRQVNAGADQVMGRITSILDGRQDLFQHVDSRIASGMDAIDAALEVRKQYIVPQQSQQATVAAAETMRRKAVAGNTANGGGTTTVPIGRPKNAKELAALLQSLESRG